MNDNHTLGFGCLGFATSVSMQNISAVASALAGFATFVLLLPDIIKKWRGFFKDLKDETAKSLPDVESP